jgi:hypothetical protein
VASPAGEIAVRGDMLIDTWSARCAGARTMTVARLVHRDPVNPGAEARLTAESVDGAEHLQEDFLR